MSTQEGSILTDRSFLRHTSVTVSDTVCREFSARLDRIGGLFGSNSTSLGRHIFVTVSDTNWWR